MTELSLDTKNRTVRVRLELLGETEPVEIQVTKYALEQHGDQTIMTVLGATASRQWLTEVLRQFVVGQSFTLPARAAALLNVLT